jgi:ABC-type multidrug transport system fused ATPase/permease subunit
VIIMNETTASIDFDIDAKIQDIIRQEFGNSTLLCIWHIDCVQLSIMIVSWYLVSDNIPMLTMIFISNQLLVDTGRLVEFNKPSVLIKRPDSLFRNLCEQSGELDLLLTMSQNS